MGVIFWGGVLRFGEAALEGAPTLLVGLFVAGVFRKLIGPETTLKLFGGTGWRSLPQSWLWGMLLPVCSIGVIPVAFELRRSGLKGGAILAFALTAPLFNPLSLLYGLHCLRRLSFWLLRLVRCWSLRPWGCFGTS